MKNCVKNLFLLSALTAGFSSILAGRATAQTFTTLHSFTGSEGVSLNGGLIVAGTSVYGTTYLGGGSNGGTVFAVNTDGSGFTTLYSFIVGSGGRHPECGLILSGRTLYGTAS